MSDVAEENRTIGWASFVSNKIGQARSWPAGAVAAAAFVLFVAAWTIHGAVAGAGRSLHPDVLEAYAWGKEFQLGYNQHGPFWAWIAGAWFLIFPKTNTSFVLLEALSAGLGLLGAWRLTGLFVKGRTQHAAALMLAATPFYTFLAYKYNADTIFISLWPWTLFFFVRSLDRMSTRDAALFGVFAAWCILAKYYAVILLITCGLSLFFHPNGRKYLLSPLPWLAALPFVGFLLPHLFWSLNNNAPPAAYAITLIGNGWIVTLSHAAKFIIQIALNCTGLIATLYLAWRLSKAWPAGDPAERLTLPRQRFVAVLLLTPPLLTILFGLVFQLKIRGIMAVGVFPLLPLFLMQYVAPLASRQCLRAAGALAAVVTAGAILAAPLENSILSSKRGGSFDEPREQLASALTALWHAETGTPLRYAGAPRRYSGAISFYSEDHPSSLIDLSFAISRWVTPEKIKQYGLLIACDHQDEDCLKEAAKLLSGNWKQTSIKVSRALGKIRAPEVVFDIFIVPPQSA
jgi:4-amino-4-deoxy-L-arabinose transferase-like glycosyltransferase